MVDATQAIDDYKGYDNVRIGTLIHILQKHDINTTGLFNHAENYQLRPDKILKIKDRIYDDKEVFTALKDIITKRENRGKRILLVSDTGTGKSYALIKLIQELNAEINMDKSNHNFAIYACPRRALIHNLKQDFVSDKHAAMLTGSDMYYASERDMIIDQSSSFLTTIDHTPRIMEDKIAKERKNDGVGILPCLLVTDEIHVLSTDATFKLDTIRQYFIAEKSVLNRKGVSLHVTATPETLHLKDYDLIIQIKQENSKNPFEESGYYVMSDSNKQMKEQFLRMIQSATATTKNKKLLIFIEDKEWIEYYCEQLKKYDINAMGIVAKKENERGEDEFNLINKGMIPNHVQVIFATTVFSSGVSITNNSEIDETWVLCSSNSMNHELTRLVQMSHRFRNKYKSFKLFFQDTNSPKSKKAFLYQTLLKEEIKRTENTKKLVKDLRKTPIDFSINLSDMEHQAGLFVDSNKQLHVLSQKAQSQLIQSKTYYNYKNKEMLIRELEGRFQCKFVNYDAGQIGIEDTVDNEEDLAAEVGLSNFTSKEIVQMIVDKKEMLDKLKWEYFRYGRAGGRGLLGDVKRNVKKDLIYFIEHGVDYEIVKQVMARHLSAKKEEPCSYVNHKSATQQINIMKNNGGISIGGMLYKELTRRLGLAKENGVNIEFSSLKDMDTYLNDTLSSLIRFHGYGSKPINLVGKDFRKLLDYEYQKSNGKRIYKIVGFMDENALMKRYGIKRIV